jgi:hypothetical protein
MTVGLTVVRHHGADRATSENASHLLYYVSETKNTLLLTDGLCTLPDPEVLRRADVVITTYSTLASELATYTGAGRVTNSGKGKSVAKGKSSANNSDSDSDDSLVAFTKKAPSKRAPKAKPCALYEVAYWRIVLGRCPHTSISWFPSDALIF